MCPYSGRRLRLAHSGVCQLAPEVAGKLVGAFGEASARSEAAIYALENKLFD